MSWIPSITRLFVLIKDIEKNRDALKDSTELCWMFCTNMQSPEELHERMTWWRDYHAEQTKKGGGFLDSELEAIMIQGFSNPEKAAETVLHRLDRLSTTKRVPYKPDEPEPVPELYISVHIDAARLFRVLKVEAYSEKTRETLSAALSAFNRCNQAENSRVSPLLPEQSISLKAVGSFLYITQFLIEKSDGHYENAMKSLKTSILQIEAAHSYSIIETIFSDNVSPPRPVPRLPLSGPSHDIRRLVPWFQTLEPQVFIDCFEALKAHGTTEDVEDVSETCSILAYTSKEQSWLPETQTRDVTDRDGYYWEFAFEYWQYALGWLEAQLTPSQFKEILNYREEQGAEKRLSAYFFGDELWRKLPERSKRSLISADRDWFGGKLIRIESILNELKIATEQILFYGLWIPLEQWAKYEVDNNQELKAFSEVNTELNDKRISPDLSHFARVCRFPITATFLTKKGTTSIEREWFTTTLPSGLAQLRTKRRDAEHKLERQWTQEDLSKYFAEFIGIGQGGNFYKQTTDRYPIFT